MSAARASKPAKRDYRRLSYADKQRYWRDNVSGAVPSRMWRCVLCRVKVPEEERTRHALREHQGRGGFVPC